MNRDAAIGLGSLVVSLVLLVMAQGLPTPPLVPIGPGFYPRILFAITAVLSVLLLVDGLRQPARKPAAPTGYALVLATFAAFIAYLVLLPVLGYRMATMLFVGGLETVLEPPRTRVRWVVLVAVAVVTALVTYYIFEVYLSVLLPRGRLTGF